MASTPEVTGYRDLVEIGRGGFARVYRAHQERFRRDVALKVLGLDDPDERTRARFERECQAMGALSWHPHVVAVYDSGATADGRLWLTMEFLEGGSLADRLAGGSVLVWPAAVTAGVEVAGALGAAHAAGTLHRDLKPENVLVGPFGEARLADFGIAAVDGGQRTTTGVASFTVAHVAPEVLRGQRPDERTDVYGLASTLHTLLAGRPPFQVETDEPVAAVMMRIIDRPPPRLGDPVPEALADLLLAGLAKDPGDRPQSAAAFGEALQSVQRAHGQPVTPLRLAPTASTAAPPPVVDAVAGAPTVPPGEGDGDGTITITTAPPVPDPMPVPAGDPQATITVVTPPPGDLAPATPAPGEPARSDRGPRDRRLAVLVGPAVLVVLVLVVGSVVLLTGGGQDGGGDEDEPVAGTFVSEQFATAPSGVALSSDAVWATDSATAEVTRLDPETGDVVASAPVEVPMTSVAVTADDAVWAVSSEASTLVRIDDGPNEVTGTFEVDDADLTTSVSAIDDVVWVAEVDETDASRLVRFDAADTDQAEAVVELDQSGPSQVSATDDVIWVTNTGGDTVSRVDPDTDEVTATIDLEVEPNAVAAVEDAVWVVSTDSRSLTRIDPATNEVVAVVDLDQDGGAAPVAVAATAGAVWVVDTELDEVVLVDPATDEVLERIDVGPEPVAITASDTDVWVANSGNGTLTHIDPSAFG